MKLVWLEFENIFCHKDNSFGYNIFNKTKDVKHFRATKKGWSYQK